MDKNWWDDANLRKLARKKKRKRGSEIIFDNQTAESLEEMPELYSVREVAAYFRVSSDTVYRWQGKWIESTRQGKFVWFTARQISECKERREKNCPLKEERKKRNRLGQLYALTEKS